MIPTTQLIYNHDYAQRLYRGDENFEDVWCRIIGLGADFEKIYEAYIDDLLEAIEKYSGYAWKEYADGPFPIYMIDQGESFVHPLSLAVNEDPAEMLKDFVYQLARRNMYFGFPNDELKRKCVQCVVAHVLSDTKQGQPLDTEDLDLNSTTIKKYLKTR